MKNLKADLRDKEIKVLSGLLAIFGGVYKPDKPVRTESTESAPATVNTEITLLANLENITGGVYKPEKPKRTESAKLAPMADMAGSIPTQNDIKTP